MFQFWKLIYKLYVKAAKFTILYKANIYFLIINSDKLCKTQLKPEMCHHLAEACFGYYMFTYLIALEILQAR